MIGPEHTRLMAAYNRWQNDNTFAAADGLSADDRTADQGAFFGSIAATLNHLLWADKIWMSRFTDRPAPASPDIKSSVFETESWDRLKTERMAMDQEIIDWAATMSDDRLQGDLSWFSGAADRNITKPFWLLVTHFFNHQTHHRGQVHAMLTAKGARPGDTDLPFMPDTL